MKTQTKSLLLHPVTFVFILMMAMISVKFLKLSTEPSRHLVHAKVTNRTGKGAANSSHVHGQYSKVKSEKSEANKFKRPKRDLKFANEVDELPLGRPIPRTALDDMLLDAEMVGDLRQCLKERSIQVLEEKQIKAIEAGNTLAEYNGPCSTSEECMQISPYVWPLEDGACRKQTHLRCNLTSFLCTCQDPFNIRWETEVPQNAFQWNPITKTCYVRGTMPCRMGIPCAPGLRCRASVSYSFNTPPYRSLCECENLETQVFGHSQDWWYCKKYWQRTWLYNTDNINKWEAKPRHMYDRIYWKPS